MALILQPLTIKINFSFPAGGNKKALLEKEGDLVCNMKTGSPIQGYSKYIPIILPNRISK